MVTIAFDDRETEKRAARFLDWSILGASASVGRFVWLRAALQLANTRLNEETEKRNGVRYTPPIAFLAFGVERISFRLNWSFETDRIAAADRRE